MPPNRLRFFWPVLSGLLALAIVGNTAYWQKKLRAARQPTKKATTAPVFDKRDSAYFAALAAMLGCETKAPLIAEDAARLAAYERIELNKQQALGRAAEPATFSTRELDFTAHTTVALAPAMKISLTAPFAHYRYELINKSDHAMPAPILFQEDRWDTPAALVTQAGFTSTTDELERAVAIWRFVCPRRVFGDPPTEGSEEHDVLKFLAIYGYGFCDDSARALAMLAELSALRSRVWALDGHVVAEIFANGHWRMLDADQQAYFFRPGAPQDILGVEELAADRKAFANIVSFRGLTEYPPKYIDCFVTRENNEIDPGGTAAHRIQPVLRAGERMAFTNYNWGRYFLGKYPTPPPRFFNGCFEYSFHPGDLSKGSGKITMEPFERGYRLSNRGAETCAVELPFAYPFPIVGGAITGGANVKKGKATLRVEDREHGRIVEPELRENLSISLDHFVSVLTASPTYSYALVFVLEPGAVLELENLKVTSDFQFAQLPLLKLQAGANEFRAHFPEGSDAAAFELTISTK